MNSIQTLKKYFPSLYWLNLLSIFDSDVVQGRFFLNFGVNVHRNALQILFAIPHKLIKFAIR